jgi:hypothetical protein
MLRFARVFFVLLVLVLLPKLSASQQAPVNNSNPLFCPLGSVNQQLFGHMTGQAKDTIPIKCDCCVKPDSTKKATAALTTTRKTSSKSLATVPRVQSRADTSIVKRSGHPDSTVVTVHFDTLHVSVEEASLMMGGSGAVGIQPPRPNNDGVLKPSWSFTEWYGTNKKVSVPLTILAVAGGIYCAVRCGGGSVNIKNVVNVGGH